MWEMLLVLVHMIYTYNTNTTTVVLPTLKKMEAREKTVAENLNLSKTGQDHDLDLPDHLLRGT